MTIADLLDRIERVFPIDPNNKDECAKISGSIIFEDTTSGIGADMFCYDSDHGDDLLGLEEIREELKYYRVISATLYVEEDDRYLYYTVYNDTVYTTT